MSEEFKATQITNPHYLGILGPFIKGFLDKVDIPGVKYESLYTYLSQTVQQGHLAQQHGLRDLAELWVVFKKKEPVAFAHWHVMGPPHIGTVYCDMVYSWNTAKVPMGMLTEEFIRFGTEHRCKIYKFDCSNERVFQVLSKHAEEHGATLNKTEKVASWAYLAAVKNQA